VAGSNWREVLKTEVGERGAGNEGCVLTLIVRGDVAVWEERETRDGREIGIGDVGAMAEEVGMVDILLLIISVECLEYVSRK
jgi:hypothetical protein